MADPRASTLLQLIWLASPALPVGGFSYSEGLEAAVEHGLVIDEATAADWLSEQLRLSLARGDLALLAQALPAWQSGDLPRLRELNDWLTQTRESAELRQQSEQMGRSLLEWLRNHYTASPAQIQTCVELGAPGYTMAMALALASSGATVQDGLTAYAFGWAENMVQAAIKSVPLGQSAGQRILARLAREIPAAVDQAQACTDAQRQAFSPMLAILSARHEVQYSRLFRS
ncbi:urease accessory protein UreF [Paucibacter sp. KBW04]|uniref:urease accessory protein UreF n=1 Tax=Paucibacter sp. KBW04 TaxID=2153361 RepID=UPI000F569B7E|nr:urease accessory UreF family protein [Paucibacter sp. KBW04]RQO55981.1 urease accessory protein UreF [Paucibacter sp. KBW04]